MSKKQTILTIVILILAFSAGWAIYEWVSIATNQQDTEITNSPRISDNESRPGPGFRQMVNILDLSPEQTRAFSKIENQYREEVHEHLQQIDSIDQAIIEEIKRENPDREKLDNLAANTGEIQHALKKATTGHFLEIKELCTPVQREKFNEILSDIGQYRRGQGRGMRRGQGRQQGCRHRWNK